MRGWILDLYPGKPGEIVIWLKLENGEAARLVDRWSPSIFIGTDNKSDFTVPLQILRDDFAWTRVVEKRERVTDSGVSQVIEAKLRDARKAQQVAGKIERLGPFGTFRLYNADVPPAQSYLYEHDIFPLAHCEVEQRGDRLDWELKDDVWAYDYAIPNLTKVELDVEVAKKGKLARFTDRIESIALKSGNRVIKIGGRSEADKLLGLVQAVREADPDFILTNDGDTFLFPYLIKRAEANGVAGRLILDRDGTNMRLPSKSGTSYFSYGRIHYKPSAMKLYGRVHIDVNTSFAYSEAGFEGLFELSRICRMPMHTSSRASIGKALSSLQFYNASKIGLLVPWKPTLAEHFKDRNELLMADRGGFIFEPKVGVYENVGELDYSCLVKDSRIVTRNGEKPISGIKEGDEVFTPFGWQKVSKVHEYRIKEKVIRLTLKDGKQITCTTRHKFPVLVKDVFEEKTADQIRRRNSLVVADPLPILQNDDLACLFGAFTAEGGRLRKDQKYLDKSRKKTRISHQYRIEFSIDKHEVDFRNFITGTLSKFYPNVHIYTRTKRGSDGITLVVAQKAVATNFLSRYEAFVANEHHNQDEKASFVRGFFEGDGGVNKKRNTVQCDQSSKNHSKLDVVCKYLRELNIKYRVGRYINKHGFSSIPSDVLELSGLEAVVRYYTEVGFISEVKQRALRQAILTRIRKAKNYPRPRLGLYAKARKNNVLSFIHETRVIRKETLDYDDHVYDLTLEWAEFPYYFANGILTHNCLYPNIMLRKNISAETVRCSCCPDSDNRVPELDWNVCKKRDGIVPLAIKIIVEKRLHYKELKKAAKGADYDRYNARQAALKWLGVTTFGYLGFNNAKFGRIDAHIAVCAWDRKTLVDTARIAEGRGFEVLHGIVDSLWVKKEGASEGEYLGLKARIESETGFAMSFEGIYKWVVFLPSKVDPGIPVLNRYFGVYRDGELKVRGIEARRHDTPLAFSRCQMEILRTLAKADSVAEAKARVPGCVEIFLRHAESLARHEIPASELAFTTNLSKGPEEYTTMTVQHAAIKQLVGEGATLHAGEGIRYVITDYRGKDSKRATPGDVIQDQTKYDSERYIELLAETCSSVLEPFDPRCTGSGLLAAYEARRSVTLS
ncbi:MAG TPA: DNA polymerase domain-containing protein [Nitrososphaerales archaeon]|nr:DNA polymerase domain-containing protein [Nitrososphaerales archaeon]